MLKTLADTFDEAVFTRLDPGRIIGVNQWALRGAINGQRYAATLTFRFSQTSKYRDGQKVIAHHKQIVAGQNASPSHHRIAIGFFPIVDPLCDDLAGHPAANLQDRVLDKISLVAGHDHHTVTPRAYQLAQRKFE